MLLNDFFYVIQITQDGNAITADLEINGDHQIFEGHFPGQPVVPGVCMVQMVKEIFQQTKNETYQLCNADYIKFLSVMDPRQIKTLKATINYVEKENGYDVLAILTQNDEISLKLKGRLEKQINAN